MGEELSLAGVVPIGTTSTECSLVDLAEDFYLDKTRVLQLAHDFPTPGQGRPARAVFHKVSIKLIVYAYRASKEER